MKKIVLATLLAAAAAAHAEPATYMLDPSHTFVTWETRHFNTSTFRGRFDKTSGTVTLDRAAKSGKVDVTIDTTSISSGVPALDNHLKSPDFFDAAQFPTARFVGDQLTFDGDKLASVAGTLTLHGKTAPVTLKAANFGCYENTRLKREVCGGDFEVTIQRSQWGMGYGVGGPLIDNVRLLVQVEGMKQ